MAEEKKEKKKPAIVKRIFKWIGLGLLAILLIAALIFQAPWKVITLLVVIFLACTVLPKPARKWFWLSVGAVVIALIIWVFLPDRGEWKPYTFDEELAALEAKRAIPDSENAAIIYNKLLEDYDPNVMDADFLVGELERLTRIEPWSSKDYPEIAQWIKEQQHIIETLIEISKIEKCRFPIVTDSMALGQHMKILAPMRQWAYLLLRAANNDLGEGRIDQALEKHTAMLQMAKHQFQQPTIIDTWVGIAIEALATGQLNRFAVTGDATEEHLSVIEQALAKIKHDWSADLPRLLDCEKLMMKNLLGVFYGINPEGEIRLIRGLTTTIMAQLSEDMKDEMVITYWHKRAMKAWTILCWFYMPSTPQKAGEIIDAKYEKFYAMAEPDFDWQREPEKPPRILRLNYQYLVEHLAGILEPAYYRIHDIYLRIASDKRGSRMIITLRRYKNKNGHWPKGLDDVKPFAPAEIFIDPQNDGAFIYKLTEENFTLYSKGKNNIDEGGKRDKWNEEKTGADDWLIWPQKSRKTKEKNADAEQQ